MNKDIIIDTSQHSQSLIILELFNFKKNGYFLDIGSSHPIKFSNTYPLEKYYDWNGLCVDPIDHKELYLKERKCEFEHAAIYKNTGVVSFSVRNGADDFNMLSSLHDNEVHPVNKSKSQICEVQAITFQDLFKKHNVPKVIDYMSMDVEGAEFLLINSFPFDDYKILALTFEAMADQNQEQKEKSEKTTKVLKENGYVFVRGIGHDFLFIHNSLGK